MNLIDGDRRLTETLMRTGSCDLSYSLPGKDRFRVNIFAQSGHLSIVLRQLESKVPTIRDMKLPDSFLEMGGELNGIIIFTGATGTGKTTSLAAILEEINERRAVHVVTLEDPIEYQHPHKKGDLQSARTGSGLRLFCQRLASCAATSAEGDSGRAKCATVKPSRLV